MKDATLWNIAHGILRSLCVVLFVSIRTYESLRNGEKLAPRVEMSNNNEWRLPLFRGGGTWM